MEITISVIQLENGVVYDETTNKPTNYTINDKYEVLEEESL